MTHDVFISYSNNDRLVADKVCAVLEASGVRCWIAHRNNWGARDWDEQIIEAIATSAVVVIVWSSHADASPQVKREVASAISKNLPLLPVRIENAPLKGLEFFFSTSHWFDASTPPLEQHLSRLIETIKHALPQSQQPSLLPASPKLSPDTEVKTELLNSLNDFPLLHGPLLLNTQFYVVRPTDKEFYAALALRDSIVLVKGTRQVGKTSLLARGLQQARDSGAKVALTDFQTFHTPQLVSPDSLYRALCSSISRQLKLGVKPEAVWDPYNSPNGNFVNYMENEVLAKLSVPFVWALDEVDRLFSCDFASDVFSLFRTWHSARVFDPWGPWSQLTLAIAHATETSLFIDDMNQSPFNVGTQLRLEDFTFEQVMDLNLRYGSPLRTEEEVSRLFRLVGGQPYLVHHSLNELRKRSLDLSSLERQADREEGLFGAHLRRILISLERNLDLRKIVQGLLQGHSCPDQMSFHRLHSGGILVGHTARDARFRCQIYATYLERHLF